jgi:hypothetical protein
MKLITASLASAVVAIGLVGSVVAYRSQAGQDTAVPTSSSSTAASASAWSDQEESDEGAAQWSSADDEEGAGDD